MSTCANPLPGADQQPARWGWPDAAILLIGCVLLFASLGARSLWHSEGRWAEIPREMFQSGDFFHPTIGGEPYFDKPLLTYWLVAGVAALSGRLDEWTVRVPSAVAGLIVLGTTLWIGRRLWSIQVGRTAASILLTTYGFMFWSRTAAADMENVAAIMLALAWYWFRRDRAAFGDFVVFYVIVSVGALMKGLPAVLVPVFAVLADVAMNWRWRLVLTPQHLLAVLLGAVVYLAPFVYASLTETDKYQSNGLALVFRENIVRFFQPFDHTGPIYLYVYYLPILLMPWSPLFVAAIIGLLGSWKSLGDKTRWLLWATALIFAVFSASGSRRGYYILPLLPCSALLVAVFLDRSKEVRLAMASRHGLRLQAAVLGTIILLELMGPMIGGVIRERFGLSLPGTLYVALPAIAAAAATVACLVWRLAKAPASSRHRQLWAMLAATAVVMGGFFCWQQNIIEIFRTERPFALELRARASALAPEDIAFYGNSSANMLFYIGAPRPVRVLHSAEELRGFVAGADTRAVITRRDLVEDVRAAAPLRLSEKPDLIEHAPAWPANLSDDDWVAWIVTPQDVEAAR